MFCDGAGNYFWFVRFNSLNELVHHHRISSVSCTQIIYLRDMVPEVVKMVPAFDFEPLEEDELHIRKGDIITVIDKCNQNWWRGYPMAWKDCSLSRMSKSLIAEQLFSVPYVKELSS